MFARRRNNRIVLVIGLALMVAVAILLFKVLPTYNKLFRANVHRNIPTGFLLYVPTGATFSDVMDSLIYHDVLMDTTSFRFAARFHKYDDNVKAGRFPVKPGMSNRDLIVSLRSANVPVRLVINKKRAVDDFVDYIAPKFEFTDTALADLLSDDFFLRAKGFNRANALTVFVPNTYEVWWNLTAEGFYERMHREYNNFWNKQRMSQAEAVGLTPPQVITLASIVEEETNFDDEKPRVAGLYLNRLNRGMWLQADPTLKFAHNNFELQRVLNRHKQIESPYNTYKYTGLPPGPIGIPAISSIEAVLNREVHDYLFMCAKADFSGYHAFAKTHEQHLRNAAGYQAELNRRGIR